MLGEPMEYPLKTGDRVRLTPTAVVFYGGTWPHWVPQSQGGGEDGTMLFAGERPYKPGAAPRPYYVRWDNGVENSYRVEDLEPAEDDREDWDEEETLDAQWEDEERPIASNIVPFRPGNTEKR